MRSSAIWNRRTFLSNAGLSAALALARRLPHPESIIPPATRSASFLACVASSPSGFGSAQQIEVYRVKNGNWHPLNRPITCEAPRSLAIHPAHSVIYVAHDTQEYLGLPRASVSAFAIDPSSGAVLRANRVALALSATGPEHISVSPDGRTLLVSASGGGSYNAFPLTADGSILPEYYALKQTGCGPHELQGSAHPRGSFFQKFKPVAYACDFGSDRIDQLDFVGGVPTVASRASLAPGSGPSHLALHPSGKALVVANHLRPALQVLAIDQESSHLGSIIQQLPLDAVSAGPLCFGPSGDELYATGFTGSREMVLFIFQMGRAPFHLRQVAMKQVSAIGRPQQLVIHGSELFLVGESGVTSLQLDQLNYESTLEPAFQHVLRKSAITGMAVL